ncbi:ATP-grasp domain-containing protein, partial [Candidatus Bipolaricaulota bacterium]|nr:ATP-grasp domain-containing protein [Candidatus Bipolaricaulota bacterium]
MNHRHIGVLCGGDSPEREISLRSGRAAHAALVRRGHNARLIELPDLDAFVQAMRGIDVAFNCLHGGSGENGTIALALEVLCIPYIGSGPTASYLAMNKALSRRRFATHGIRIPPGFASDPTIASIHAIPRRIEEDPTLTFPLVVKPIDGGSSLDVSLCETMSAVEDRVRELVDRHRSALVEKFIPGHEITVGILETAGTPQALPVIEIRGPSAIFDYDTKYIPGRGEFIVPAPIPAEAAEASQQAARRAHKALGCRGFSRVDLRLGDDGLPYV